MKKKYYVRPSMMTEQAEAADLICTSPSISSDVGIGYGGVDEDGTVTVDSRGHAMWDDEE
jgi:hypothetical protein